LIELPCWRFQAIGSNDLSIEVLQDGEEAVCVALVVNLKAREVLILGALQGMTQLVINIGKVKQEASLNEGHA
jgi:hypothetical protein